MCNRVNIHENNMKKLFSFVAATLLIVACTPKDELKTPFKAGQKVTLAASMGGDEAKNIPGKKRITGLDNGAQIDLTWTDGDQITVKVGDATSVFTLESGAGSANGTFTGEMPAAGTTYSVEYPANYDESVLTNQTYTANGFGKGLMKMSTKTEGTLDGGFELTPDNTLLGLQLTGAETLGDIVLTNTATSETYTLNCAGVTLSNTAALFYLVVPAGEWPNGFVVDVKDTEGNVITSFTKASAATFSTTEAMVMPVKFVPYAVDLGLPSGTKWASCNVGATKPEEFGDYFAWGETSPKSDYSVATNKWMEPSSSSFHNVNKYNTNSQYGDVDNKTTLDLEDDAAAVNWGGSWRMPTTEQITELINNCDHTKTTLNGFVGWMFTSKLNGNSIFFPSTGQYVDTSIFSTTVGNVYCLSNTLTNTTFTQFAFSLFCSDYGVVLSNMTARVNGTPVRAVCP